MCLLFQYVLNMMFLISIKTDFKMMVFVNPTTDCVSIPSNTIHELFSQGVMMKIMMMKAVEVAGEYGKSRDVCNKQ